MRVSYRVAVFLVALIGLLVLIALSWDGFNCQPECEGPPWNCEDREP